MPVVSGMRTVLIVDDSVSVREQVGSLLVNANYGVIEAVDGVDALEKLGSAPQVELVIADINMPRMNGLEMVEKLKGDERYKKLFVLMLTSEGQPALIARARKAGANGWIVKPFRHDLLVSAVKKILPQNA